MILVEEKEKQYRLFDPSSQKYIYESNSISSVLTELKSKLYESFKKKTGIDDEFIFDYLVGYNYKYFSILVSMISYSDKNEPFALMAWEYSVNYLNRKFKNKYNMNQFLYTNVVIGDKLSIKNDLGQIYSQNELYLAVKSEKDLMKKLNSGKEQEDVGDIVRETLKKTDHNIYKIKKHFITSKYKSFYTDDTFNFGDVLSYFRSPRVLRLKKENEDFKGEPLAPKRRGKKSNAQLVDSWDDISNLSYSSFKSWKTNSKRKKQWKPKI